LRIAAQLGNLQMMRCLVAELSADVDRVTIKGDTPLHIAVDKGNLEAVQCLVKELEADVNLGDDDGYTPVYIASSGGTPRCGALLG
jgi:ankyrin repeat protein